MLIKFEDNFITKIPSLGKEVKQMKTNVILIDKTRFSKTNLFK